jgi:branched-chain amino acid transport system permease protein
MAFELPPVMDFTLFSIGNNAFPAYKFFMIAITVIMFAVLLTILKRTRVGLVIQAALSYPQTVEALGHNVPQVFMGVFGVGTALAGIAGVIAGPILGTFPGMAFVLGSIVFVVIVVGGLGSLWGALIASMLIGWMTTFAKSYNVSGEDVMGLIGLTRPEDLSESAFRDIWTMTLPQIADILPYLFLVLVLIFRPYGLMGRRET